MEELVIGLHISMEASITAICSDDTGTTIGISMTFAIDIYIFSKVDVDMIPEHSCLSGKAAQGRQYLIGQSTKLQEHYDAWASYLQDLNKENSFRAAGSWEEVKAMIMPVAVMGAKIRDEIDDLLLVTDNEYHHEYKELRNAELDNKFLLFESNCMQIMRDLGITFQIGQWDLYQRFEPSDVVAGRYSDMKRYIAHSRELDLVNERDRISEQICELTNKAAEIKMDRNEAAFSIPETQSRIKEIEAEIERKDQPIEDTFLSQVNEAERNQMDELSQVSQHLQGILSAKATELKADKKAKKYEIITEWLDQMIKKEKDFIFNLADSEFIAKTGVDISSADEVRKLREAVEEHKDQIANFEKAVSQKDAEMQKVKEKLQKLAKEYEAIIEKWPQI